ncbi:MAG: flagellar export protein FliJ [Porticoccaceae bacterium]|nr:flagellar export protein FliJ [Porticoccaceae bacterium]
MKPIWQVLLSKAEREVRIAQQKLADAQQKKNLAIERREKLDNMLVEYSDQLRSVQLRSHSTGEVGNFQQFIAQLQSMKSRSKQEMSMLDEDCTVARKYMMVREHERLKIDMLAQREREKFELEALTRENREIESNALQQFNFKERI